MVKSLIAFIIIAWSAAAAQQTSLYPDVTVLASDAKGITLEFRPRYSGDRKIVSGNREYSVPQFAFEIPSVLNRSGSEDIRTRVINLVLPSSTGNTVSVAASDHESVPSYLLAPVPDIGIADQSGSLLRTYREEYRSRSGFYPARVAELTFNGSVKGVAVGKLVITPFQYQSSTRTLKRYSRLVVRIDYGPHDRPFTAEGNDEWARVSLINYPQAALWQAARGLSKKTAAASVLATGTWVKVEISENGIYKLDAAYLRSIGIDPVSKPITDIKVFGGEGKVLPENIASVRPADLPQMAVEYVDTDNDGTFDTDDHILFYGQGVSGWLYDASIKRFGHYGNPYTFSNYYFISSGSSAPVKAAASVSITGPAGGTLTSTGGKMLFEEEKFNFNQSGQEWVSAPINPGENQSRTVSLKLTGWIPGTSVTYQSYVYGRATEKTTMTLEESGQTIGTASFNSVDFNGYNAYAAPILVQGTIVPVLTAQRTNVKYKYNSASSISTGYIGWLRVFYRQQLTAEGNQLSFSAPDSNGTVQFAANGFTRNDIRLFEVSDFHSMRSIQYSLTAETGSILFKDSLTPGKIRTYVLATPDQYKIPKSSVKIPNSDLHAHPGADFIIITHNDFKSEALRLKQHKESLPGNRRLTTMVADIDTIFNEFGLGMPDPTAMRDFLRHAYARWNVKPKYVLFFGDASYDYRGILQNDRSWVPAYETPESNDKISSFANEDYFAYVDSVSPWIVAIAHGRLTPRTSADAKTLVDKIILYETGMAKGKWKNVVTLVADDMWTPGNQFESEHITQTETIAGITLARGFDVHRIYMEEYATVFASTGRRKPDVRSAILDQVNKSGTLLLNYVGHGNPKVWAHESILTQDDVRNQFLNADKLTFITAATCDWGRFEEAGESSSAEDVILNRKGGAIGVISATRAVYSNENALLNQRFYHYLFSGKPTLRLGDAYLLMKNDLGFTENNQKYFLLVDPTISLAAPSGTITIDSIKTASGVPADSLRALERIVITATVRDTANAVMTGYNGTAELTVNDAEFVTKVTAVPGFAYSKNGAVIYSGQASITNGVMQASFIVPKDISYTNKNGRIAVYFSNGQFDGRGSDNGFVVGGTNLSAPADSVGPEITIYFDTPEFRSGDVVNERPMLYVALKDSNGINSSTHGIGHRLEAWIDGSAKSIDLTESYQGTIDSYKEGTAAYAMEGLSEGNHSIAVRAWDVYNNSSSAEAFFVVASSDVLSIQQLFNVPNPVATTTVFTFQHNQLTPIDVTIKIYSVTGRLMHTIERPAIPDRFVRIGWDRRDRDGDELGNGIYFYRVTAKTIDGKFTSEATGKMAVIR